MTNPTPPAETRLDHPGADLELSNPIGHPVPPRAVRRPAREAGLILPHDFDSEPWSIQL